MDKYRKDRIRIFGRVWSSDMYAINDCADNIDNTFRAPVNMLPILC